MSDATPPLPQRKASEGILARCQPVGEPLYPGRVIHRWRVASLTGAALAFPEKRPGECFLLALFLQADSLQHLIPHAM